MTVARAIWFTAPRTAEIREEELPPRGPGEITVVARYSLISPGTEMNLYRGEGNLPDLLLPNTAGRLPFPVKFSYQTLGEVVDASAESPWRIGQRVFCTHPHQDRFNILEAVGLVDAVPDDVSSRQAIFASMFCVALNASKDCPVRAGDHVVVSGLGQIGTFCAFLSRKNAGRLILIDPDSRRRERVGWIDADAVIAPEQAGAVIAELTEGRGADVYIEASGAPPALQQAVDNTGTDGTIVPVAWYGTREVTLRLSPEFHLRRQRIISSQVLATIAGLHPGWDGKRAMAAAMRYLGGIDPANLISHELPFERAPEAYELIDQAQTPTLGVLLVHQSEQ